MPTQDRLTKSQAGNHRAFRFAREYGQLTSIGVNIATEQLNALNAIEPWAPVSEHIRRALDLYLQGLFKPGDHA